MDTASRYLAAAHSAYASVHIGLFSHGVRSAGLAEPDQWLHRIGCFALVRYGSALRRLRLRGLVRCRGTAQDRHRAGVSDPARRDRRRRPSRLARPIRWCVPVVARRRLRVGALLAGLVADPYGLRAAVWVVAVITALSGLVVAVRMYETHGKVLA